ncbi:hypothetical protein JNW90_10775 [Micromonospora sp. STR1s_5]|nr:hypothetical protein [Micromonospora sp. STR1s_5]
MTVAYPLDALVSYHYYKADKDMAALVATRRLRMIGDSGAFSAFTQGTPIKMPEYVTWVRQWDPYLCWTAALDVIGDPVATLRNWREMRDRHQLVTVPTLHVGTDPRWMDPYAREGCDFMGLGGMVGRALQSLPWVVKVFRYARDHHPQMRFHIWGITHKKFLTNLPAYSADSSEFGGGYRFARLRLFDPRISRHVTADLRPANGVYSIGPLLRQVYGTDPALVRRPTSANRHLLIQLAARSNQFYAAWLQRRHQVSAPRWALHHPRQLDATDATGTRIHAVTSASGPQVDDLERAVSTAPPPGGVRIHAVDGNPEHLLASVDRQSRKE